jgi:hypothetical protein
MTAIDKLIAEQEPNLKLCPFCGRPPRLVVETHNDQTMLVKTYFRVICRDAQCSVRGPAYWPVAAVVRHWNHRVDVPRLEAQHRLNAPQWWEAL